jgi:hypothetical protein
MNVDCTLIFPGPFLVGKIHENAQKRYEFYPVAKHRTKCLVERKKIKT